MWVKVSSYTTTLIVGGAAFGYGLFILLIRLELIVPETLNLYPPLVLIWIGICLAIGFWIYRKKRTEKHETKQEKF